MTYESRHFEENELCEALEARYHGWHFAERSDEENFAFAHGFAKATLELFPYLAVAGSEEFNGAEAPYSLKPVLRRLWAPRDAEPMTIYDRDLVVGLGLRNEDERIEPYIPGFEEMRKSGKTFDQMVGELLLNPELLQNARPGQTIKDEAIVVRISDNTQTKALEFITLPDRIELAVYGQQGKTRAFSRYVTTYHNKPRVLAETTANLALLGAKHCLRMNNPISPEYYITPSEQCRQFLNRSER